MNNERYNQIVDDAYKNYVRIYENFEWTDDFCKKNLKDCGDQWEVLPKEEFINKIKTDPEFSKRWGLKIEERELSWEERVQWVVKNTDVEWENLYIVEEVNKESSPTKLITLTYKEEEKIEVYE